MPTTATRTCLACRKKTSKAKLLRWTCSKEGMLCQDRKQTKPGRGYYSHSGECAKNMGKIKLKRSK